MIKIVGGTLRGRMLKTTSGDKTRPSSSKVREAIFNIIQDKMQATIWLDLFAGTGAVGIEAISRGADKVTFVEKDYNAFKNIKENLNALNISEKASLSKNEAVKFLSECKDSFDFIFIDPPYLSDLYEKVFKVLNSKPSLLKDEGFIIVEHASKITLSELNFEFLKLYKYGDTNVSIYKKQT